MTLLPPSGLAAALARAEWLERARDDQVTPSGHAWTTWLILAGRGWGKTRTGAEDVAWFGMRRAGSRIAVVAPTYADARDTCVEGDSGLLGVLPREMVETWNRSLGELILVNGSRFKLFSADEPDRLRGPQHHRAWCDELAAWKKPDAWDQLLFGLRLGDHPQVVITTTPKPTPLVRRIAQDARTRLTRGRTMDNAANLAPSALELLQARYAGTRLGRQELEAEILDDNPGALWTRAIIENNRLPAPRSEDERQALIAGMRRIVVAMDPAATSGDTADEMGIVVAGLRHDGHGCVLADLTARLSPDKAARRAIQAYDDWRADRIVGEVNNGGEWIGQTIRLTAQAMRSEGVRTSGEIAYTAVHASRGKLTRAEPVAALDEQHKVHHVGAFPELEDQLCEWEPLTGMRSPDRLDARVWALTELMVESDAYDPGKWSALLD